MKVSAIKGSIFWGFLCGVAGVIKETEITILYILLKLNIYIYLRLIIKG